MNPRWCRRAPGNVGALAFHLTRGVSLPSVSAGGGTRSVTLISGATAVIGAAADGTTIRSAERPRGTTTGFTPYGDAHTAALPLVVRYTDAAAELRTQPKVFGSPVTRRLPPGGAAVVGRPARDREETTRPLSTGGVAGTPPLAPGSLTPGHPAGVTSAA